MAQGVELLGRIEGVVGPPGLHELQGILEIDLAALALAIGGMGPTDADALVDLDSAPAERFHDVLLGAGYETLGIGVFDAQDHRAAVLACEEVVIQCRADAADVQRPGGAGCETHPNGSFHRNV